MHAYGHMLKNNRAHKNLGTLQNTMELQETSGPGELPQDRLDDISPVPRLRSKARINERIKGLDTTVQNQFNQAMAAVENALFTWACSQRSRRFEGTDYPARSV